MLTIFCHGQQDSSFVKKIPLSGSLSNAFGKIQYMDWEKQKEVSDVSYALALSAGVYLGYNYNFSLILNFQVNQRVSKNVPWLSDYYFILSRDKYVPNTFYWGYNNFGNNKYSNSLELLGKSIAAGIFFAGYHVNIPEHLQKLIKIHSSSRVAASVQCSYAIRYYDQTSHYSGNIFNGKPMTTLNVKYVIINNFFISGSVNYYLRPNTQLSWDTDYTYGFGFENWKPGSFSFTYAKFINKFPWSVPSGNAGILYGTFTLSFNYALYYKKQLKKNGNGSVKHNLQSGD